MVTPQVGPSLSDLECGHRSTHTHQLVWPPDRGGLYGGLGGIWEASILL